MVQGFRRHSSAVAAVLELKWRHRGGGSQLWRRLMYKTAKRADMGGGGKIGRSGELKCPCVSAGGLPRA